MTYRLGNGDGFLPFLEKGSDFFDEGANRRRWEF
jgi:hypothetical protein